MHTNSNMRDYSNAFEDQIINCDYYLTLEDSQMIVLMLGTLGKLRDRVV